MADARLKLLIVDDDDLIIQSIRMALPEQWRMRGVSALREIPNEPFHAAFVDMHLSSDHKKVEGLGVVKHLSERDSHLEIVAMSGDLDRDIMENCLKNGASRFLAKPLSPEEVLLTLEKIEALILLRTATQRSGSSSSRVRWIGESTSAMDVQRRIASLRGEGGPILIEGESGTGKEVAAALIHAQEEQRPFIAVNVAALPENMFESEIFGHVRGAFTGADQNKMGLAEAAHGGDLFLDEIEALPLSVQAKLLRFLESGEVRRVGSKDTIRVQARVIAATNQNLSAMVKEGKFREDLLWRLNGKKLNLPPLRERKSDIAALATYFVEQERPRRNKTLSDDAIQALQDYNYPGNVRELKRICEQLSLLSPLPVIRREDVLKVLPLRSNVTQDLNEIDLSRGLPDIMADFEAQMIRKAISTGKEMEEVASFLKISRSSLYKKIKDYGIEIETQ